MKPLMVEVIAYAPTQFFHCQHCEFVFNTQKVEGVKKFHQDAMESSIPPELMKEYQALSDWVMDAVERYEGRVIFKVIDATTMEGLLKSVRYGVHKFPAIIVNAKEKQVGTEFKKAETLIDRQLTLQPA